MVGSSGVGALLARTRPPSALPLPVHVSAARKAPRSTWGGATLFLVGLLLFFLAHAFIASFAGTSSMPERHVMKSAGHWARRERRMSQVVVLGSHHTGTSVVTRLLMEMGCYASEGNLKMLPGNPLKYFEHNAVLAADMRVLQAGTPTPLHGPHWLNFGFDASLLPASARDEFLRSAREIARTMDNEATGKHGVAWVLKDPRMALLAREWISVLDEPVCVIVSRNPLEVSRRMAESYNRPGQELSVREWALVWEEFTVNALHACVERGAPIVVAQHAQLITSPFDCANALHQQLSRVVRGLEPLSRDRVDAILGPDFVAKAKPRPKDALPDHGTLLTERARTVWHHLAKSEPRHIPRAMLAAGPSWAAASAPPHLTRRLRNGTRGNSDGFEPRSSEAYATIVTGNDRGFVAGALVLAATLRVHDKQRDLVAMMSVEADDPVVRQALEAGGWRVYPVAKLEEPWYNHHPSCMAFTPGQQVRWGRMFSKLRIYSLPYKRVVYLDTDTMVHRELDAWFELPGDFYAERSPSHRGVNAGIMVVRPSERVLEQLIDYARHNPPLVFWPSQQVGCTEQELLNRFWGGEHVARKLNDTRHFDFMDDRFLKAEGREENALRGPRASHCLTTKCNKPWDVKLKNLVRSDSTTYNAHELQTYCDPALYLAWHRVFWLHVREARGVLFPPHASASLPRGLQDELSAQDLVWLEGQLAAPSKPSLLQGASLKMTGFKLG